MPRMRRIAAMGRARFQTVDRSSYAHAADAKVHAGYGTHRR